MQYPADDRNMIDIYSKIRPHLKEKLDGYIINPGMETTVFVLVLYLEWLMAGDAEDLLQSRHIANSEYTSALKRKDKFFFF